MRLKQSSLPRRVKFLTCAVAFLLTTGCSYIHSRLGETCKSHAHLQMVLEDYLSRRFNSHSPVRLAVIPYSTPANLSAQDVENQGMGNDLAWQVHAKLLSTGLVPIVEVFNRPDWPRKKEEFFTGNFGAIDMARQAGYDLVLVGNIEPLNSLESLTARSKLIEVESGVTVWYGTTTANTIRDDMNSLASRIWLDTRRPDLVHSDPLTHKLARCIVEAMAATEPVP